MIVLETERLILRRLTEDDAGFILRLLNEPSFLRYIGDRGVRTPDDARRYVREGPAASYERHGFGFYLVELKEGGAAAGICGLVKRPALEDPDIGFAFLPAYWSKGYAFESASAVMNYARDVLALRRVLAIVSPDNEPSARLLGKLGLKYERLLSIAEGDEVKLFSADL
ncbi:MAG TPA: GNAT family N-acetyltransferase [Pyrinomonadaceae bacterium]|nr:GNAT family N-acetyltransferase [Pyrinomonadaceae bacterium]